MATSEMREKIRRKDEIEKEIYDLHEVLKSHGTNMTDVLVDNEEFPRSDLDVLTVRKTRVRIIYLKNDLKKLMEEIEEGLYCIHAEAREKNTKTKSSKNDTSSSPVADADSPFLHVDIVTVNSPAAKAGLEVNDLITRFGSITINNFTNLKMVGELVANSKGSEVNVTVQRRIDDTLTKKSLLLTPTTWEGKGLLGCNIVPVSK